MTPDKVRSELDLLEFQWDGVNSTALLSAEKLPMQSEAQAITGTSALVDPAKVALEVVEELTGEEAKDRHRLEFKIERGIEQVEQTFYEIGKALAELRDRRLYRSTHKNFGSYCRERFDRIKRRQAEYLIVASEVVDDLKNAHNCAQFPLPTSESQVRSMKDLTSLQRQEVWQTGLAESGGVVPTAKTIKRIVERIKERDTTPPPISHKAGDIVRLRAMGKTDLRKHDGQWAIVVRINESTVTISLNNKEIAMKPYFLEEVEPKYWVEIKAVQERIGYLQQFELDPIEVAGLEVLLRRTSFTPKQIMWLKRIEHDFDIPPH